MPYRNALGRKFVERIDILETEDSRAYTVPVPSGRVTRECASALDLVKSDAPDRIPTVLGRSPNRHTGGARGRDGRGPRFALSGWAYALNAPAMC